MATLARGITFGATETVTNTKLHNLVDQGSISGIVNSDCDSNMGLIDTKLADITTGNKIRGTALGNLASIPSTSGVIPFANIPYNVLGLSLSSIPNTALVPLSQVSLIDGAAFRNLASIPVGAGQMNYQALVQSLASGGIPQFNGSNTFIGKNLLGANIHSFSVYDSGNQTINTDADLTFNTEEFDKGNNFTSNTFTAPIAGIYLFTVGFRIDWGSSTSARLQIIVKKNGSQFSNIGGSTQGTGSNGAGGSIIMNLAAADTISISVLLTVGSNTIDIIKTSTVCRFTGALMAFG